LSETSSEASLETTVEASFEAIAQPTVHRSLKRSHHRFMHCSAQASRQRLLQASFQASTQALVQTSTLTLAYSFSDCYLPGSLRSAPPTEELWFRLCLTTTYGRPAATEAAQSPPLSSLAQTRRVSLRLPRLPCRNQTDVRC
jgi:hypothetical protein